MASKEGQKPLYFPKQLIVALLFASLARAQPANSVLEFTPEQFGAVGDGVTADDLALRRLANAVEGVKNSAHVVVHFSPGKTYYCDEVVLDGVESAAIELRDVQEVTLHGNGATIRVNGSLSSSDKRFTKTAIKLTRAKHVTINCLTLVGSSDRVTRGAHTERPTFGVHLCGGEHITINRVTANDWMTDGFYVTGYFGKGQPPGTVSIAKAVTLNRCTALRNARQGLSATGQQLTVNDSEFSDTGTGPYGGHAPSLGIDHEPNFDYLRTNGGLLADARNKLTLNNVIAKNNLGGSFAAPTRSANETRINGGRFTGPTPGSSVGFIAVGDVVIDGAEIESDKTIWIGKSGSRAEDNTHDTLVRNSTLRVTGGGSYQLFTGTNNPTTIEGTRIELRGNGQPFSGGAYYAEFDHTRIRSSHIFFAGTNVHKREPALGVLLFETLVDADTTFESDYAGPAPIRVVGGTLHLGTTFRGNISPF